MNESLRRMAYEMFICNYYNALWFHAYLNNIEHSNEIEQQIHADVNGWSINI